MQSRSKSKTIKNIVSALWALLLAVMFIILLAAVLMQLPSVRRSLSNFIATELSSSLGVDVNIDNIRYFPFSTVEINNLSIADEKGLPMIYMHKAKADLSIASFWRNALSINLIDADSLTLNIRQDSTLHFNYEFLLDPNSTSPIIEIQQLTAQRCALSYDPFNAPAIEVSDLSLDLRDLSTHPNATGLNINNLSFNNNLLGGRTDIKASLALNSDTISLSNAYIAAGSSFAKIDNILAIPDSTGLKYLKANITNALLSSDLLFLLTEQQIPSIGLTLKAELDSSRLAIEKLRAQSGRSTYCELEAYVSKDWRNASSRPSTIKITEARTSFADLSSFSVPLPDALAKQSDTFLQAQGQIDLEGEKMYWDFTSSTSAGKLKTSGNASSSDEWHSANFNFSFDSDLDLKTFTNNTISRAESSFSGNGNLTENGINYLIAKGNFPALELNGYTLSNINLNGIAEHDKVDAMLQISDDMGDILAVAEADWSDKQPYYSLALQAEDVKTHALGITPSKPGASISFRMRAETYGTDPMSSESNLHIADLFYYDDVDTAFMKKMQTTMGTTADGDRLLSIESDVANGFVRGVFDTRNLTAELHSQLHNALPSLIPHQSSSSAPLEADIDLKINGIQPFSHIFFPEYSLADSISISGHIENSRHSTWLNASMSSFASNSLSANNIKGALFSRDGQIIAGITIGDMSLPVIGSLAQFQLSTDMQQDAVSSFAEWHLPNNPSQKGQLNSELLISKINDKLAATLDIDRSKLTAGNGIWSLDSTHIDISDDLISIKDMRLQNDDRFVHLNGRISANEDDSLHICLHKIVLENIFNDPDAKFSLAGDLDAQISLNAILADNMNASLDASIDRFFVNGDNLEHFDAAVSWNGENQMADLNLAIVTGGRTRTTSTGFIDGQAGDMDLNFDIDSLSTGFLNFYLDACIDQWQGSTSGDLRLYGPLDNIQLESSLKMNDDNSFRVKQTNVVYYIDKQDSLFLSPTRMTFANIRFSDNQGHPAVFGGYIAHDMFSNLKYHLTFDVNNQLLLNTTRDDSPSYFGTIYGTGQLLILGTTDDLHMLISARTEPHSSFSVVPTTKSDIGTSNYITFRQSGKADDNSLSFLPIDDGIVTANMNLEITPDAELSVIINPQTDNMLKGRGHGLVEIEIDGNGDLNMYGNYTIESGLYNFTFENIINKQFVINNGGQISWDGDPYGAIVDIVATYKLKASLYDLVQSNADDSNSDLKRRVPINCNILLSNKLTSPDIKFDIEIPSSQNFSQYTFDQYVNTEEEMNRQVFSLLLANKFYSTQDASSQNNSQSYLGTTGWELLSNQLSNWMSQNKYNVGVGVNYRPGDDVTNEEYEVALSTQVLDNKILLSGNIGYGRDANSSSSDNDGSVIGDFDVEVKLNKRGNVRVKAYTHSNNDVIYETSPTTQGIGISFTEEFDSFRQFIRYYWNKIFHRRNKQQNTTTSTTDSNN